MITLFLLLALLIAVFAVIFALQNPIHVIVSFLFWQFDQSLALVLLLAVALGVLIGLLTIMPTVIRAKLKTSNQKKRIDLLEKENTDIKAKAEELDKKLQIKEKLPISQASTTQPETPTDKSTQN